MAARVSPPAPADRLPGDMFGLKKGIRFGFGYDIERTLKALALVDEILAEIPRAAG